MAKKKEDRGIFTQAKTKKKKKALVAKAPEPQKVATPQVEVVAKPAVPPEKKKEPAKASAPKRSLPRPPFKKPEEWSDTVQKLFGLENLEAVYGYLRDPNKFRLPTKTITTICVDGRLGHADERAVVDFLFRCFPKVAERLFPGVTSVKSEELKEFTLGVMGGEIKGMEEVLFLGTGEDSVVQACCIGEHHQAFEGKDVSTVLIVAYAMGVLDEKGVASLVYEVNRLDRSKLRAEHIPAYWRDGGDTFELLEAKQQKAVRGEYDVWIQQAFTSWHDHLVKNPRKEDYRVEEWEIENATIWMEEWCGNDKKKLEKWKAFATKIKSDSESRHAEAHCLLFEEPFDPAPRDPKEPLPELTFLEGVVKEVKFLEMTLQVALVDAKALKASKGAERELLNAAMKGGVHIVIFENLQGQAQFFVNIGNDRCRNNGPLLNAVSKDGGDLGYDLTWHWRKLTWEKDTDPGKTDIRPFLGILGAFYYIPGSPIFRPDFPRRYAIMNGSWAHPQVPGDGLTMEERFLMFKGRLEVWKLVVPEKHREAYGLQVQKDSERRKRDEVFASQESKPVGFNGQTLGEKKSRELGRGSEVTTEALSQPVKNLPDRPRIGRMEPEGRSVLESIFAMVAKEAGLK